MKNGRIRSGVGGIGGHPIAVAAYRYVSKRVVRYARPSAHPPVIIESVAPRIGATPSIDRDGARPLHYSAAIRDPDK